MPANIKKVPQVIKETIESNEWTELGETYKFKKILLNHYSINQRWIIVFSNEAFKQTEHTLEKAKNKEKEKFSKAMYHLKAKRFDSEIEAIAVLEPIINRLLYHDPDDYILHSETKYLKRGKPKADTPKKTLWQISTTIQLNAEKVLSQRKLKSCYVLATNVSSSDLPDVQLLKEYKKQSAVERGFRFLKDPVFFTSSLFLKKPERIQGLLMVMTLSLLVYSIAERRLRNTLKTQNNTLPNQIGKKTKTPTLRWCFQILQSINFVSFDLQNQRQNILQGIADIRKKILSLFGDLVTNLYNI